MPNVNSASGLTCMNCGAPIKSGFFCAKCQSGDTEPSKQDSGWKGSRFTGDAKKKRQQEMLMEDVKVWSKRVIILLVLAGIGFGVYSVFGDRIVASFHKAQGVAQPREKYDPTKDAAASEDDQGQQNGTRAFSKSGT